MIQQARSSDSRSFLRELEFSLVLIKDDNARNHFLTNLAKIYQKRKETKGQHTGERDTKNELLTYLKQKGKTQTANIWARALSIDRNDINTLLATLQQKLFQNGIEGVLEIHLQDREINSPHIQFVGNEANKAEVIIAHTLVEFGYETSIENALSKKDFEPYYKKNEKARYPKRDDITSSIQEREMHKKYQNSNTEIDKLIAQFDTMLKDFRKDIENIKKDIRTSKPSLSFSERLQQIREEGKQTNDKMKRMKQEYRLRRLRRRRR